MHNTFVHSVMGIACDTIYQNSYVCRVQTWVSSISISSASNVKVVCISLSTIDNNNTFSSTMLLKRLNYLPVLLTENDIVKPLAYEEANTKYEAKSIGK